MLITGKLLQRVHSGTLSCRDIWWWRLKLKRLWFPSGRYTSHFQEHHIKFSFNTSIHFRLILAFLEDICPFAGQFVPLFLNFWVSKWEGSNWKVGSLILTCYTFPSIHLWCNTSGPLAWHRTFTWKHCSLGGCEATTVLISACGIPRSLARDGRYSCRIERLS